MILNDTNLEYNIRGRGGGRGVNADHIFTTFVRKDFGATQSRILEIMLPKLGMVLSLCINN